MKAKKIVYTIALTFSALVLAAFLIVVGLEMVLPATGSALLIKLGTAHHVLKPILGVVMITCFSILVLESGLSWTD